ncbi:MAG TPA: response regulator [Candidatus Angelobacter sp.]|nr:response regulator [Candidatus Angelobacter sp.]
MLRDDTTEPVRVLFVDDEPNIRLTLPAILEMRGYHVTVAATVAEALTAIHSQKFDVLLSDLNISHPADGFTVVGAMRSVQPDCVTLILTGYPAFETALQAIRSHVDDYLTKPADIEYLLRTIRSKLTGPRPAPAMPIRRLASIFRDNLESMLDYVLQGMKSTPELAQFPLTDAERLNDLGPMLHALVRALESGTRHNRQDLLRPAYAHGRSRREQGYTAPMIVEDTRCVDTAIVRTIEENLLAIDISELFPDWSLVHAMLQGQLKASIEAFLESPGEPYAAKTARTA